MIRRCASAGCGYLVRWHAYCPLHRPDLARSATAEATELVTGAAAAWMVRSASRRAYHLPFKDHAVGEP